MSFLIGAVFLIGLAIYSNLIGKCFERIKLPSLIGMMIAGLIIGPHGLNGLPAEVLKIAPNLKDIALVTVLFIGGMGISSEQIKKIGRPAIFLSIIPASLEGFAIAILSTIFLDFTFVQGAILGFIIAAVSPAVLIPAMINLIERKVGQKKSIPQLLLVGASADDSIAITFFTSFLMIYFQKLNGGVLDIKKQLILLPISIVISLFIGWIVAYMSSCILRVSSIRVRVIYTAFICLVLRLIENKFHFEIYNSLLTIMCFGFFIRYYQKERYLEIYNGINSIWKYGKIYLFTFVGMAINPKLIGDYFWIGLVILFFSLSIRALGVWISLIKTDLNYKERVFCIIAYLPKATVQSAKAGVPLQMGVTGGEIMQAIAILSVLITAPIGAIGIEMTYKKLLEEKI